MKYCINYDFSSSFQTMTWIMDHSMIRLKALTWIPDLSIIYIPTIPNKSGPVFTFNHFWGLNLGNVENCSVTMTWYSGDLKSDYSKSGKNWNPEILKIRFQMVWFSKVQAVILARAMVPTIWKPDHSCHQFLQYFILY